MSRTVQPSFNRLIAKKIPFRFCAVFYDLLTCCECFVLDWRSWTVCPSTRGHNATQDRRGTSQKREEYRKHQPTLLFSTAAAATTTTITTGLPTKSVGVAIGQQPLWCYHDGNHVLGTGAGPMRHVTKTRAEEIKGVLILFATKKTELV